MTFTPIGQTARMQVEGSPPEGGDKRGETGAVTLRQNSSEIANWLAKQAPADMDKAAVSRASSHNVGLRIRYEGRYPSGPNGERLPSYDLAVSCEMDGLPHEAQAALDDLENFMTPAPTRQIEEWIAELSVISAKRQDDHFSETLRIEAYASRLRQYPADVVRTVLLEDTHKFFPTWSELERRCEMLTSPRRCMIAALKRGPVPPEPVRRPPTQEEKDRIQALIDEMFPDASPQMRKDAAEEVTKGNCMAGENMVGFSENEAPEESK